MSDSEVSDINNDDDLVRRYERDESNSEDERKQERDNDTNSTKEEVNNDDEENIPKKVNPSNKKRGTRKLYVLNTERLKGSKGIHTIEKLYEGFTFKGKGYEKEDLNKVMKRLEYWSFRLFPKLDFDDFLGRCEQLGHKKDLHTHLKKYRLNMITADDNCAQDDMIEDEKDEPVPMLSENTSSNEITNNDFQRLFDEIK